MAGKTGEKCQESGEYRCGTHDGNRIPIAKGNTFPPCSWGQNGGHAATWHLVRRI